MTRTPYDKILEDAERRAREMVEKAEKERDRIIEEAEKEWRKRAEAARNSILREAEREASILIANAKVRASFEIAKAKEEVIREVFEKAESIIKSRGFDVYKSLENLIRESLGYVEKPAKVMVGRGDAEIAKKILADLGYRSIDVEETDEHHGGCCSDIRIGARGR